MFTILFVCTGNTCRSVMAQALAQKIIQDQGLDKKLRVLSAGISVIPNSIASKGAIEVIKDKGLPYQGHASAQLTASLIEEADLILAMTRSHKQYILDAVPQAKEKLYTLKEYANPTKEDPQSLLAASMEALEKSELAFYEANRQELEELKNQYEQLKDKLKEAEQNMQQWYTRLHQATAKERETLTELEEQLRRLDVSDPVGSPVEVYHQCADEISEALSAVIDKLGETL